MSARAQTRATSRRRERFDVWNEVPLVPQTTGMSCWAAAAAMLVGWRDRESVDPKAVATGAGKWSAFSEGLEPEDVHALARAWKLVVAPGDEFRDLDVADLREALREHGPLWIGEASPGLHSIVVTGIYGDGSEDETYVRINDPWPVDEGERYVLSFREFERNVRAATEAVGEHAQILHTGGRQRGASGFRHDYEEHSVMEAYDQRPDPQRDRQPDQRAALGRPAYGRVRAYGQVSAGEAYLQTSQAFARDPLSAHGGSGENLCVRWNAMPAETTRVDVVVHLHGYRQRPATRAMLEDKVARSGVVLDRRPRPTLGLIPRGRRVTEREIAKGANPGRYTFEGLTGRGGEGLEILIEEALTWFGAQTGGPRPTMDRLILTAHSGGVIQTAAILRNHAARRVCNPEEVHLFDGLYADSRAKAQRRTDGLVAWAQRRIEADAHASAASPGGALRLFFLPATQLASAYVGEQLQPLLSSTATARAPWYRVERSSVGHGDVAAHYGESMLVDAGQDVKIGRARGYGTPLGLFQVYRDRPPRRRALDLPGRRGAPRVVGMAQTSDGRWLTEAEIDETVRETPVHAQGYALALRSTTAAPAQWADDALSIDYRHLGELGVSVDFSFSGDHLAALADANRFALPESGKVLFGLRGCQIVGTDDGQFHAEVRLSESVPDHGDSRCVLGVWDLDNNQVAVFRGSTVPNAHYMRQQLDTHTGLDADEAIGGSERNCNMLLTGRHSYAVGRHRRICGAFREPGDRNKVVLRSRDDRVYETSDTFDRCQPADNIHPSFRPGDETFSSAGCQTVRGNAGACDDAGVSTHVDPDDGTPGWASFRTRAGLGAAGSGDFPYILLTGREARLTDQHGSAHALQRLRYGSSGADVESLQAFLIAQGYSSGTADGDFGPGTAMAWIRYQQDRDGGHADGVVTPDDATAMGFRIA